MFRDDYVASQSSVSAKNLLEQTRLLRVPTAIRGVHVCTCRIVQSFSSSARILPCS